jgi:hypothetical protein
MSSIDDDLEEFSYVGLDDAEFGEFDNIEVEMAPDGSIQFITYDERDNSRSLAFSLSLTDRLWGLDPEDIMEIILYGIDSLEFDVETFDDMSETRVLH